MSPFDWIIDGLSVAAVATSWFFTWKSSRYYREARRYRDQARHALSGE